MSFILDALKKSESSRRQQSGPAFAEVPSGRRHASRPWWALAVAALLVLNLVVLTVVLLRDAPSPDQAKSAVPPPTPGGAPAAAYAPAPMGRAAEPEAGVATGAASEPTSVKQSRTTAVESAAPLVPATASEASVGPARDPAVRSLAEEAFARDLAQYDSSEGGASSETPPISAAAAVPQGPPAVQTLDVAPAIANQPSYPQNLPTVNELALQGAQGLPELHLDIHVYSTNPAERFVFINLQKYVEGQALKEGPTVERITRDGVVLNNRGMRFVLPRQ